MYASQYINELTLNSVRLLASGFLRRVVAGIQDCSLSLIVDNFSQILIDYEI